MTGFLAATGETDGTSVPVVRLENVTQHVGGFLAVDQADFDIDQGELFSMLGPSGCGRTTRMIAGVEQHSVRPPWDDASVPERRLAAVRDRPPAARFAECVRTVTTVARRRGLDVPVFRSPPRLDQVDRTLRRRPDGGVVVAVRLADRPFVAIQADVIDGVVAANRLDGLPAARFRRAAWAALDGRPPVRNRPDEVSSVAPVPAAEASPAQVA
jgi:energy-coupling factor transporter ATP-binding protein EcfA2